MIFVNEIIVTVIVFCLGISSVKGQEKDETCQHSRSGQKGICKPIRECQEELANIQRGLFPQQCGFEGIEAIVCCLHPSVPKLSNAPALSREIENIPRQNETCYHARSGQKGICKPIKECPEELDKLESGLDPQLCEFGDRKSIVCCLHPSVPKSSNTPALSKGLENISRQKCKEYSKHVYKTVLNPTLLAGASDVTINQCFVEEVTIYDNNFAKRKELPHLAIIGYGKSKYVNLDWLCVGSLISEKHVLTAAHCTVSKSGLPQKVRLGTVNLDGLDEKAQQVGIDKFTIHPDYRKRSNEYDIAILFLERNVEFSAFVRPACLSKMEDVLPAVVVATGFSTNENDFRENSIIQKTAWNYVPKERCIQRAQLFESPNTITDKVLCSKYSKYQGKCQDNSNEMLQVFFKEPYCMYGVVGLTSYGESCSVPNLPSFTKLDQYTTWIESTIWF